MHKSKNMKATMLPYMAVLLTSLFVVAQSFAAPWNNVEQGYDAAVFSYIGWMMKQGAVPYIDAWDNKGPLLYVIEFIGALIHEQHGIFVVECIAVSISSIYMYKTARLFAGQVVSSATTIFCTLLSVKFFENGNRCEEFALPFLCVALYLLTRYVFQNNHLKWYQTMIVGACATACALIRINLMAPILVYCGILFIYSIGLKKWKDVFLLLLNFLSGFAIMVVPFVVYLWKNRALAACISAAYTMNFKTNFYSKAQRFENMYNLVTSANVSYALILMVAFIVCKLLPYSWIYYLRSYGYFNFKV